MKKCLSIVLAVMLFFSLTTSSFAHDSKPIQNGIVDILAFPFELVACVVSLPAMLLKGDRYCGKKACPLKNKKECPPDCQKPCCAK